MRARLAALRTAALGLLALAPLACRPADARPPAPTASASRPGPPATAGAPRVVADERGFTPGSISLARGGPGTILFRRTSDDTCATAVVFPALGIEQELPLNQDVAVTVPTSEARSLTFQCGMGMYRSRVVVR